jgi:hypothetical protein
LLTAFGSPYDKTKWQGIGNQIDAAPVFARADFVKVHQLQRRKLVFQSQARLSAFDRHVIG